MPSATLLKLGAGLALAAAIIGGIAAYGAHRERQGAEKVREAARVEALEEFARETNRAINIGQQLAEAVAAASALEPKVLEKYRYVKTQAPLPVDCRVDADRMRAIADGLNAANAIRRSGGQLRTGDAAAGQ